MGPLREFDRRKAVKLHPGSRRAVGVRRFPLAAIFFQYDVIFRVKLVTKCVNLLLPAKSNSYVFHRQLCSLLRARGGKLTAVQLSNVGPAAVAG